jgi:hypothetical protein
MKSVAGRRRRRRIERGGIERKKSWGDLKDSVVVVGNSDLMG